MKRRRQIRSPDYRDGLREGRTQGLLLARDSFRDEAARDRTGVMKAIADYITSYIPEARRNDSFARAWEST